MIGANGRDGGLVDRWSLGLVFASHDVMFTPRWEVSGCLGLVLCRCSISGFSAQLGVKKRGEKEFEVGIKDECVTK
jgi:hypothetical protein